VIKNIIIASRYAEGFISYADSSIGLDKALEDLKKVKDLMRDNPEFVEFLFTPYVAFVDKEDFIDKVLKKGFSEEIKHFLKLLIDKGRIDYFSDIVEYARVKYSHFGETEVLLKTTFPLDLSAIRKIRVALEQKYKKKFKFYIDLDSNLLGGIQVIMGNTVIDGSVRRRLDELKEKLMSVGVK